MKLPDIAMTRVLAITALMVCFQNSEAKSGIAKYIIGGREAVRGQFPWMVQISLKSGDWASFCGGSIITSRWILTAAHCSGSGWQLNRVYSGGVLISGMDAEMTISEFDDFVVHEAFVPREPGSFLPYVTHDIALIKLSEPLLWSANIKPVKLPSRSQQYLPEGSKIATSGWGFISDDDPIKNIVPLHARTLMFMEFELRDNDVCHQHFFLCSKLYTNLTTHPGDSGGPWVWVDPEGVNRLVGVISQHQQFEYTRYYFDAVSVASYLDWIHFYTGIQIED